MNSWRVSGREFRGGCAACWNARICGCRVVGSCGIIWHAWATASSAGWCATRCACSYYSIAVVVTMASSYYFPHAHHLTPTPVKMSSVPAYSYPPRSSSFSQHSKNHSTMIGRLLSLIHWSAWVFSVSAWRGSECQCPVAALWRPWSLSVSHIVRICPTTLWPCQMVSPPNHPLPAIYFA